MRYRFADFELDTEERCLSRGCQRLRIQPKVLQLLEILVVRGSGLVPQAELMAALWPDVVVARTSLTRLVKEARRVLGDDGSQQDLIQTVRGRGYRLSVHAEAAPAATVDARRSLLERIAARVGRGGPGGPAPAPRQLLIGRAGLGKTTLARAVVAGLPRSIAVGTAWLAEGPGRPPYFAWLQILRCITGRPRPIGDLADRLRSGPASAAGTGLEETREARVRLFEAVASTLGRAAAHGPLLLVIDDVHELGAESLALLDHLAQNARIGFLAMARVDTPAIGSGPLAGFSREVLEPLDVDGIHDLLDKEGIALDSAERVAFVAERSGGNPFHALELARRIHLLGASSGGDRIAPTTTGLLARSASSTSKEHLPLLEIAAAVGGPFTPDLLEEVAQRPRHEVQTCIAEAIQAGLLEEREGGLFDLAHPLLRESLYGEIRRRPYSRARIHARIGSALRASGAPTSEIAHHLAEGAAAGGAAEAVRLLQKAAEEAEESLAHAAATANLERALEVLPLVVPFDRRARAEILCRLGRAKALSHGLEPARETLLRAMEVCRASGFADLFAEAALAYCDRPGAMDADAPAILEEALAGIKEESSLLRTLVTSRLAGTVHGLDPARSVALSDAAVSAAEALGDPGLVAQCLEDRSYLELSAENPEGWLADNERIVHLAEAAGDAPLAFLGHAGVVTALVELGDLDAARRQIDRLEARATELATPYAKAVALSARGMLCNLGGDFATGRALAARAATWGARSEHVETSQITAACAFYLGLQDGTAAELEPFILEAAHRVPTHRAWEAARLKLLLETGRHKELARALPELARHGKDIPRDRHWLVTMALLAECSWELRATEWCGPLQEALEPFSGLLIVVGRASLCYGSVDHFRGLLALARGDLRRAESLLERALAQHERIASPPWVAETQAALAALAAGRRDREGAVSWLDRAVATAERLGMRSLLRRADAIRATLPEGPHS